MVESDLYWDILDKIMGYIEDILIEVDSPEEFHKEKASFVEACMDSLEK